VDGSQPDDTDQQNKHLKKDSFFHHTPSGRTVIPIKMTLRKEYIGFRRHKN
jgi:hypothetical protein